MRGSINFQGAPFVRQTVCSRLLHSRCTQLATSAFGVPRERERAREGGGGRLSRERRAKRGNGRERERNIRNIAIPYSLFAYSHYGRWYRTVSRSCVFGRTSPEGEVHESGRYICLSNSPSWNNVGLRHRREKRNSELEGLIPALAIRNTTPGVSWILPRK